MVNKNFITLTAIAASLAILMSGCTSVDKSNNAIPLTQNYETINAPQWDASAVTFLEGQGWTVTNYQTLAESKGIVLPATFSATNKDNTCHISYSVRYEPLKNTQAGEDYLTRSLVSQELMTAQKSSLSTQNIKISENNSKLEMLEATLTTDNYASDSNYVPITDPNSTPTEPTPAIKDGNMNTIQLTRVFAKQYKNPFAQYSSFEGQDGYVAPDRSVGNPILSLSYSCAKTNLDMNLWKDIVSNAKINSEPLSVETTK